MTQETLKQAETIAKRLQDLRAFLGVVDAAWGNYGKSSQPSIALRIAIQQDKGPSMLSRNAIAAICNEMKMDLKTQIIEAERQLESL